MVSAAGWVDNINTHLVVVEYIAANSIVRFATWPLQLSQYDLNENRDSVLCVIVQPFQKNWQQYIFIVEELDYHNVSTM